MKKADNKILCEDRCEISITSFEDPSDAVSEVLEFLSVHSSARTSGPSILLIENPMEEKKQSIRREEIKSTTYHSTTC